ncbi:MAG: DUF1730 domain-containing protein [Bacillota bacterium]|nr:DUF1730 domain-containing protein [Bacillota bacterium]
MNEKTLKEQIIKHAEELGIKEIGFCKHNGQTAVCCLFPYYMDEANSNLSVYARGTDYHLVVLEILKKIMEPFDKNATYHIDKGEPFDQAVAYKSGLGFMGKNHLLINKNLGSWCFIGYALTDLDITPDKPLELSCSACNACIEACPGKALAEDKFFTENCASYISQKKGQLSEEETDILLKSGLAFGCDICQKVCPHNTNAETALKEFKENRVLNIQLSKLSDLSNKEFKENFKDKAFAWRGKEVLIRNLKKLVGMKS